MTDPANEFRFHVAPVDKPVVIRPAQIAHIWPGGVLGPILVLAPVDRAFDEFIAAGQATWLVARQGRSIALPAVPAHIPAGQLDLPRLDSSFPANMLSGDTGKNWFLPDFVPLSDNDPNFAFAATQTGEVAAEGGPFNRATLTVSLRAVVPTDLANMVRSNELSDSALVPDLHLNAALSVPVTAHDGSVDDQHVPGNVSQLPDGTYTVAFTLTGAAVEAAYEQLTRLGGAALQLSLTYSGWQTVLVTGGDTGFPPAQPVFGGFHFEAFGDGEHGVSEPVSPLTGVYRFYPVTARFARSVTLGLGFASDAYRGRFTIAAGGLTRPIIDVNDLSEFATARSEYRELTSLGDVQARYPSLRQLYLDQVSGTVVAVPVGYGIVRGAAGIAANCDSIVDDSPVSITGCRFHFTFTMAPLVDPIDLAQLAADLPAIPEATGRTLRPTLPVGLDPRHPATLDGFPAATTVFADGVAAHTLQVAVDIADDQATPATTKMNLFLQQLTATGPAPLFANVAIRLDDVFAQQVQTQATLNLHQTAGSDDLTVTVTATPAAAQLSNHSALDLTLRRYALVGRPQLAIASLADQVLPAGQSTTLAADLTDVTSVVVSSSLIVPAPLPKAATFQYISFHTQTVQQVQHPLTVNAAGLNFTAAAITSIDIHITVTADAGLSVPDMTLTPSHTIDFVHALIPIDSAVTGLDTTVTLTVTTTAGQHTTTIANDFIDQPILIITNTTIA